MKSRLIATIWAHQAHIIGWTTHIVLVQRCMHCRRGKHDCIKLCLHGGCRYFFLLLYWYEAALLALSNASNLLRWSSMQTAAATICQPPSTHCSREPEILNPITGHDTCNLNRATLNRASTGAHEVKCAGAPSLPQRTLSREGTCLPWCKASAAQTIGIYGCVNSGKAIKATW
jgi:hypothetical protein